jgi:serine/threonine-protein kinase
VGDREAIALGKTAPSDPALGETALGETALGNAAPPQRQSGPGIALTMRATVLPRLVRSGVIPEAGQEQPRFEPLRLLGQGGIGEVTLARDNDIDRPVAVKRLRQDAQNEESLHRFVHEIRTVGQLEHPNIAPVHDVGIDDHGQHYFVMRYIEGETLEAIITKLAAGDPAYHTRFTFEHRVQIFLGICHAIEYAHAKQILHRDLKPSNIMVGPYGEVVVMDWGIAKKKTTPDSKEAAALADTLGGSRTTARDSMFHTRHGSLIGTPAYMSPEQAAGHTDEIDERSDVYSLCALFYELLALQHPLPGRKTVQEMLASVIKDEPELAAHLPSNPHQGKTPAELAWFVQKGLEKDPAKRYQSVHEMTEEMQRVLAGGFHIQCFVTFLKKGGGAAVRFTDRHPFVALGGAIAMAAVFVLGLVAAVMLIAR